MGLFMLMDKWWIEKDEVKYGYSYSNPSIRSCNTLKGIYGEGILFKPDSISKQQQQQQTLAHLEKIITKYIISYDWLSIMREAEEEEIPVGNKRTKKLV